MLAKTKITRDNWFDRYGNRYIRLEQGNVFISIQMYMCSGGAINMNCYIDIKFNRNEQITLIKRRIESMKECKAYIKQTYQTYKHLYRLDK
mgnify:CR=1 FL=1